MPRRRWTTDPSASYLDADVVYDAVWPDPRVMKLGLGVVPDFVDDTTTDQPLLELVRALAARVPAGDVWAVWYDDDRGRAALDGGQDAADQGLTLSPVVSAWVPATLALLGEWLAAHPGVTAREVTGFVDDNPVPLGFIADRELYLARPLELDIAQCAFVPPRHAFPFPGIGPLDPGEEPPELREVRVHPGFTPRDDHVSEPWTGKEFHVTYGATADRVALPLGDLAMTDLHAPWQLVEGLIGRASARFRPRGVNCIFGAESDDPTRTYDLLVTGPDRRALALALVDEWPDEGARWRMRRGWAATTAKAGAPIAILSPDGLWRGLGLAPWDDPWLVATGPLCVADGSGSHERRVFEHRGIVRGDWWEPPFPFALTRQSFMAPTRSLHFDPDLWPLQRYPVLTEPPSVARIGTLDPGLAVARGMQALAKTGRLDGTDLETVLFGPAPLGFEALMDQHLLAMPFRTMKTKDRHGPVWLVAF